MKGLLFALLAAALASSAGHAQDYPLRPIRVVVPSSPGGGIDASARVFGSKFQEYLGQPAIIENRPGASMVIGTEYVSKAAPDGYTLLVAHYGAMSLNPLLFRKLSYDPLRDFEPISLLTVSPLVLVVHPATGFNSLRDLIAYAHANPGKLNNATGGPATVLALELFNSLARTQITSIQYKGLGPSMAAVLAGETQMALADAGSAAPTVKGGKVRVLGIASRQRSKANPDWPTMAEAGLPGYEAEAWVALFAPAGTPRPIVNRLSAVIQKAATQPDVQERSANLQMDVITSTPEQLAQTMRLETEKWGRLMKERNLNLAQ
jgi:tripartite-type tricarboxylate transporter receptor subunit TctC